LFITQKKTTEKETISTESVWTTTFDAFIKSAQILVLKIETSISTLVHTTRVLKLGMISWVARS